MQYLYKDGDDYYSWIRCRSSRYITSEALGDRWLPQGEMTIG